MIASLRRWTAWLACAAGGLLAFAGPELLRLPAQEKGPRALKLLVRSGMRESPEDEPRFVLRPNGEFDQVFTLALLNPGPGIKKNVQLRIAPLASDGKLGKSVLTGSVALLNVGKSAVKLDKAAQPKEAKEPVAIAVVGPPFRLGVEIDVDGAKTTFTVPVLLQNPREYTEVTNPVYDEEKRRLTIKVRANDPEIEPGIPVSLDLPAPLIPGLRPVSAGRREGALDKLQPQLDLIADGIVIDGRAEGGRIYLNADGYDRAYLFAGTFAPGVPQLLNVENPRVRILTPHYVKPAKDLVIPVEVDALLNRDLNLEIAYRQIGNEAFTPLPPLRGFRQQTVLVSADDEGQLAFKVRVHDWNVPLRTAGILGRVEIRARILDSRDTIVPLTEELDLEKGQGSLFIPDRMGRWAPLRFDRAQNALLAEVVLDDTVPDVLLGGLPAETSPKKALRPSAQIVRGEDQAPVGRVLFFLGDAVKDEKALPKGAVEGRLIDPARGLWEPKLDLVVPEDQKERIAVSVLAQTLTEQIGVQTKLVRVVPAVVEVAGKALGSISGTLRRGGRPQPKGIVTLLGAKGAIKATANPDAEGRYEFKDLEPGTYGVVAAQPAVNTSGTLTVTLPPGKDRKVEGADIKLMVMGK